MSGAFGADWLDLREPFDAAARSRALLGHLAVWGRRRRRLRIVDLGAGTGANLRWMAPALGEAQDWTLVEFDRALIDAGAQRLRHVGLPWRYRCLDLAVDLERAVEAGTDLITASALLDLVSEAWLERLVALQQRTGAALYLALSYDGRITWMPEDGDDAAMTAAINRHQRTGKSFGPALGPDAVAVLQRLLASAQGELRLERSDWVLEPAAKPLQSALLAGYAEAATMVPGMDADQVQVWAARRRRAIDASGSQAIVGHQDLLFLPPS